MLMAAEAGLLHGASPTPEYDAMAAHGYAGAAASFFGIDARPTAGAALV